MEEDFEIQDFLQSAEGNRNLIRMNILHGLKEVYDELHDMIYKPIMQEQSRDLLEHCKSNFIYLCEGINEHRLTYDKDITEYVRAIYKFLAEIGNQI